MTPQELANYIETLSRPDKIQLMSYASMDSTSLSKMKKLIDAAFAVKVYGLVSQFLKETNP